MKKAFCVLGVCLFVASFLWGHETFVIPGDIQKEHKAGDTARLFGISSHYFAVGEELEPPDTVEMHVYKNGVKGANLPLEANRDRVWYEAGYRLTDDAPVIAVFRSIGGFYSIMTDGSYAEGNRPQAAAANPGKTVQVSRYFTKWAKLCLNPSKSDKTFSVPLGHDIEIVPLDNPADMRRNSTMKLRVLYKGQPYANAEVKATHDYYDYHAMDAWAKTAKTDGKGEASFRLDHPNLGKAVLWGFQVGDTRKSTRPDVDEDNLKAMLLFAVR
ncbi:MAG: DUF4198 domain-containing protein [Treponema sp.]|jgi:uncharacterized GH25 family protein|nr:DUF4198 domain-containing protein [Treponema sp.]